MDGSLGAANSDALKPGTTLGRYEIRRLLGQGGMGCVYEAQHRDLKKRVAIKTLLPALASNMDARERFLREGEAASRIRHPHVVDVTDVGSEGSVIYLVMEYLEGEDLARLIARQGALSLIRSVDIMLPVAAAISTAHEQGVIHRDLKPENIFLVRNEYGDAHPKVLDFGISKVLGDSRSRALTGTAATMGTINYLPPEQLHAAREADARSDQYALGTILYECVTGVRAFEEETFYVVLNKIAEGRFSPPSKRRPDLPVVMEEIIVRAMSLEPARRFDSVRHLGLALLEFASEKARLLWTPFFAAVRASASSDRPSQPTDLAPWNLARQDSARERLATPDVSDRPRIATLIAPEAAPGGTRNLASPHRPASTTMRTANGERASRTIPSRSSRSRTLLLVASLALIAAGGAVALLRGTASKDARILPTSATDDQPPPVAPLPVVSAPDPQTVAPQVRVVKPEPSPHPTAEDSAATQVPPADPTRDAPPIFGNPGKKPSKATATRSGSKRESKPARRSPSPEGQVIPPKAVNDAVIID